MDRAQRLLVLLCLALAGCANLNTVHRSTSLPHDGVAVHLDAPQRVTIANKKGWACSEPSPDALQAYASSMGLGFGAPTKESISLAQALSASAGSIGLRTQSITLMRDALFRICELYFNGAITEAAAIQLMQRSQDLTLGVLAIEQLTGAVVAQQVILTNSSAASAAATINDSQRELERAQALEAEKKKALETADKAFEAQTKAAGEKKVAADAAKAKAADIQKMIDELTPKLAKAKQDQADARSAKVSAEIRVKTVEVLLEDPRAAKKKLEPELVPLHTATEAAKKAYKEAETAKKPADELAKLQEIWDKAAAAEKPVADKLQEAKDSITKLEADLAEENKGLVAAKAGETKATKILVPIQIEMDVIKAHPDQVAADKAAADLKSATDDQAKKKTAAESAKTAYDEAQAATKAVEKLGSSAITNAAANASGTGQFSTASNRYGVSKETVEILTNGTVKIVEAVMNKGHMTDTCGVLMMSKGSALSPSLLRLCGIVVQETLQIWKENSRAKIEKCQAGNCKDPPEYTPYYLSQ